MKIFLLFQCLSLGLLTAGCQSDVATPRAEVEATGRTRMTLQPQWRDYAEQNYRGVLLADLKFVKNVQFLEPPVISAARNVSTGATELTVTGQYDASEPTGSRLRHMYFVSWVRSGSDWRVLMTHAGEGLPAPEPVAPPRIIVPAKTQPTTQP